GADVVDPHVEAAEPLARLGDERLAGRASAEVGLCDQRLAAAWRAAVGDRARARLVAAIRDEHGGTGAGERLGDALADAAARTCDDGADGVEPALGRLRRAVRRVDYPSVPPANGWRASAAPSRTDCAEGSLPSA